ncbi:MAG: HDOD domain-containing protein [Desulfobulbaceae bacterium]|nr:HDOD domain-containing protein [Desulfobulbaceae bacterium]HIJ79739.1 HDOD domain-containing protein [Deltaproteobacteria bacterium]
MNSILLANSSPEESARLIEIISAENCTVTCIDSQANLMNDLNQFDLILLSYNFTESQGIDFLMQITKTYFIPILIITPLTDPQCAIEALRSGAYNYIVETEGYESILSIAIQEAILHYNEREEMKKTILQLRNRVDELEVKAGIKSKPDSTTTLTQKVASVSSKDITQPSSKNYLIQEIISRFKRGDINLPPVPAVINQFNEVIRKGASIPKLAETLKNDVGISTKLINVSNSSLYKGVSESKNLEDAINRLGIRETRQFVHAIANRNLYTSTNNAYKKYFERLWQHSLACAYAAQSACEIMKIKLKEDAFTLGLLHDVGILILLEIINELSIKDKAFKEINSQAMQTSIIQLHGKFGAVLLKRWNFHPIFIDIAMNHEHPNKAKTLTKELLIINLADLIAKEIGQTVGPTEEIDIADSYSAGLLKASKDQIELISTKAKEQINTFGSILS